MYVHYLLRLKRERMEGAPLFLSRTGYERGSPRYLAEAWWRSVFYGLLISLMIAIVRSTLSDEYFSVRYLVHQPIRIFL